MTTNNSVNNKVSTVATSTNASFFPLMAASSTDGNQAANLSTGLTYNPNTNNMTATSFTGALVGNASTANSAGTATDATNTINVAVSDDTSTSSAVYPTWVTATTGNHPIMISSPALTFVPSTGALATTGVFAVGKNSGTNGQITFKGSTSGSCAVKTAAAAGTGTVFQLPADNGTNTYVLQTNGSGVTSWVAGGAGSSNLGTSVSAASPRISGDATTGFYTAGAGKVDVAISGVKVVEFSSTGIELPTGFGITADAANLISVPPNDSSLSSLAIGDRALAHLPALAAGDNIAIGKVSLGNSGITTDAAQNVMLGNFTGSSLTSGADNVCMGHSAGSNITTGYQNVFIGNYSGNGPSTGANNVAIGYSALAIGSADYNTAVGTNTLLSITTGGDMNTALGFNAGVSITTGANNVILGPNVASTTLTTGSNNILIGVSSAVTTAAAGTSNTLKIGGTGTAVIAATATDGTPVITMGGITSAPGFTLVNGSYKTSQTTAPTIATTLTSATITAGGTDEAGELSVVAAGSGTATVTFNLTHASAPKSVVLYPSDAAAITIIPYISSVSTTTFVVTIPVVTGTVTYYYKVSF